MTMKKKRRFRAKVLSAMLIVSLLAGTAGTSAFASADDPAAVSQLEETDGVQDPLSVLEGSEDCKEEAAPGETDVTETDDTSAAPEGTGENEEASPAGTEETTGEPKEDGVPVTPEETGENNSETGVATKETSGEPEEDKAADGTEETGETGGETAAAESLDPEEITGLQNSTADTSMPNGIESAPATEIIEGELQSDQAKTERVEIRQPSSARGTNNLNPGETCIVKVYAKAGYGVTIDNAPALGYWPVTLKKSAVGSNNATFYGTLYFKGSNADGWTAWVDWRCGNASGTVGPFGTIKGRDMSQCSKSNSAGVSFSSGSAQSTLTVGTIYSNDGKVLYTIKYVDTDGSIIATYTQKKLEITKKPTITKEGFTLRWSPSVAPTVTGDATYKAVWVKAEVTLTYSDNKGTKSQPETYYKGNKVTVKSLENVDFGSNWVSPEKRGYTFQGWDTDSSADEVEFIANDIFTINNNTTLYAVWEKKQNTGDDTRKPKLTITKTADKNNVKAGEWVEYTIIVRNDGPGTASGVTVKDILDGSLTFVSAKLGDSSVSPTNGVYSIGDLSSDASATLKITAAVKANVAAGTQISNTATADCKNNPDDPTEDTVDITVIEKTDPEPKKYLLTIHYLWDGADEQYKEAAVNYTETLEDGADFEVNSPELKVPFAYTVAPETVKGIAGGNQQMEWNVIYTPKVQINHIYRINGEVKGSYLEPAEKELPFNGTLTADGIQKRTDYDGETYEYTEADTVQLPSNPADLTEQPVLNLYYDRMTDVAAAPALKITKEADREEVEAGKTVNYTVTVENTGKAAATDVKVTDILPAELTLVSATVALDKDGYALGDIPAGETRTFRITAAVKEEVPAGTQIINVVTAEYSNRPENDPVPRDEAKVTVVEEPEKPTTPDPTPGETTDPDPDPDPTPGRTTDPDPDPDPTPGETTDPDPTPEPGGGDTPTSGPVLTPVVIRTAVPTTTTTVPVPAAETPAPTETAEVTDGEVPAAEEAGAEAAEDEELLLADEGVPLATGAGRSWALINFALMNLAIFESLMLLIGYFVRTKNSADEEDEEKKKKLKKKGIMRVISLPVAVISLIAFCLTEDISLPTALVDRYTLLMAIIALIQTVVVFLSRKEVKDEDEEEAEAEA